MRDVLMILMVFATVPMTFLRPNVGLLAWCWISYMNPHRLTWGFAYEFPLGMLIALSTLAAWILSQEPKRLAMTPISVMLAMLFVWMSFANLFAMVPDLAYQNWEQATKILLMTVITMIVMQRRERIHALVWVIVLSLVFFGVKGGIFTILTGGAHRVWGPPGGVIAGNNEIGLALVMILPLMRYLQIVAQKKWVKHLLLAAMGLTAIGVIDRQ